MVLIFFLNQWCVAKSFFFLSKYHVQYAFMCDWNYTSGGGTLWNCWTEFIVLPGIQEQLLFEKKLLDEKKYSLDFMETNLLKASLEDNGISVSFSLLLYPCMLSGDSRFDNCFLSLYEPRIRSRILCVH